MSLFCEDHQALVCSHCVSISHRTCGSVMTPEDYAQKLNRDDVIRTRLSDGEHVMDALVKDFSIQLELLESNKHEAERKISLESQKIGDIVCRFRDQAMNQLSKVHKEQKGILESSIQRCKSLKNSMINTSKVSGVISSGTDPVQKISIYQRGKAEINSCTQMVHDLVRPFEGKLITFEPECLHEKIESFASIGRISANNQIRDFPVPVDKWLPLSDRIANHHDTFSVKLEKDKYACSVRDILWYDDDVVLLTDANNKNVKLFSEKGEFIDVLHMDDRPWSVCKLPNNRVAVTRPDAKMISIVKLEEVNTEGGNGNSANVRTDIPFKKLGTDSTDCTGPDQVPSENNTSQDPRRIISLTLENSITTNLNCYGICHVGDMFVVSNGKYRPYQLYTVAPDGRTDLIMEHESPSYYITRSITEQDIVVGLTSSVPRNVALYCLKSHSSPERINISPAAEKTLNNAYGMDVDRDGNIYLCCGGPMSVVQVTSDRETVRELVGVEQGIKDPRAISVLHNKVVVTDVAKENANIIKIFHLR
ncbi:uncharacterized protein LOC132551117 [Ylistrum balloti]|uniref:uncharacterized protein LOC132551117 n=1 Tax=Ylistrum balloti TaxID=509963 RepID=UPI002905DC9F|nr:uncharacterized protein LOC132551117 [Ylistrum balloti]